jgi:glycosyltransferase involved in cell wall biosynthesis
MEISVVIPMYNSENTIVRALNSIKEQTKFEKISEIIIVNDGSTDNSLEIVEEYKRINKEMPIVLITQKNGGVSSARNLGISKAKSEWIALLDSDDEWLPNKILLQVNALLENPEIDFLGGDISEKKTKILFKTINRLYHANIVDLTLKVFPQTSTAIFRKRIFEEIGGYDEKQKYGEDANYFMKICKHYNCYHLPKQMVRYDGGKPAFGFSGLSANLKKMHDGSLKNIKELKDDKSISGIFYIFLRIFYELKYIRRVFVTKTRNWR